MAADTGTMATIAFDVGESAITMKIIFADKTEFCSLEYKATPIVVLSAVLFRSFRPVRLQGNDVNRRKQTTLALKH